MPLPASYITTEEQKSNAPITSNYFSPGDIPDNGSAELIICGEPDDHMVAGWQYFGEKTEGEKVPCYISREQPPEEEWLPKCGTGYGVEKTKAKVMEELKAATNSNKRFEALKQLSRPTYFLAFAAWHCEREDFVCAKITQIGLRKDIERHLMMAEDYAPMTPGGVYNFRLIAEKIKDGKRTDYRATVRMHRKSEKEFTDKLQLDWDAAKAGIWLPRYFMESGQNNIFDGKPSENATLPAGLPAMARDEYGADEELKGF